MPDAANALSQALTVVGDRWSLLVIDALIERPQRFAELEVTVPGIATNVLTQRLRQLEASGLLMATPYTHRPVRYAYSLTEAGRGLAGVVRLLAQWSADHHGGEAHTPVHQVCGSPLMARWWCPTCEQPSDSGPPDEIWV